MVMTRGWRRAQSHHALASLNRLYAIDAFLRHARTYAKRGRRIFASAVNAITVPSATTTKEEFRVASTCISSVRFLW